MLLSTPFRTGRAIKTRKPLYELGIFTTEEMLNMWCETTPRSIFPGRNIGRLDEGFEASFLVLGGDPIEDFDHVRNILMRVKQGRPLVLEKLDDAGL